jgi:hypothetical protein
VGGALYFICHDGLGLSFLYDSALYVMMNMYVEQCVLPALLIHIQVMRHVSETPLTEYRQAARDLI